MESVCGESRELEEGALGIDEALDPFPRQELSALAVELDRRFRPAALGGGEARAELRPARGDGGRWRGTQPIGC
jgi:hypothetical protein